MPVLEISSLEARLKKLSEEIHAFQQSRSPNKQSSSPPTVIAQDQNTVNLPSCPEIPVKAYKQNLFDPRGLNELTEFLSECRSAGKFNQLKGRQTVKFGVDYKYSSDLNAPASTEIPPPLQAVIDKLMSDCSLTHQPNSVLINYFPPTSAEDSHESCLPFHSDDEPEILADSEIATVSIGEPRTLSFKPIHAAKYYPADELSKLTPSSNSVYVMTRSSQAWYKHGIVDAPTNHDDHIAKGRFSITFRTVSKSFTRSSIILGDSNTKLIKFGAGAGTMGQSFPGKRVKAGNIRSISPVDCIGYSNAIIVCGTNDLRVDNLKGAGAIHQLVDILALKISQIRKLCPKIKLFVTAVLPSRLPLMNRNIMSFNRLVGEMLHFNFDQSVWQIGVGHFLDSRGLLAMPLTRNGDEIHLGTHGIAKFVRCVKHWVFVRERQERTRQGKQYAPVGVYPT